MNEKIERKLITLGITPNIKGFEYIATALELLCEDSRTPLMTVYESVAKKHNASRGNVERAIRYAISKVEPENFPGKKLKNSEFLHIVLWELKREEAK